MKVKNPYGSHHELHSKPESLADSKPDPVSLSELAKALIKHDPDESKALAIAKKYRD